MDLRLASIEDLPQLETLWKVNAERMQLDWVKFKCAATMILESSDNGLVFVAEQNSQLVAFMMFTYEWSDWRDGIMYWL